MNLFMNRGRNYNGVSMELNLFRSFVTVAETRSFRRAAKLMHVTQPTLSRQIARLETELGTQLFERYGRHVECTVSGERLLPLAQSLIARVDDIVGAMRAQEQAAGVVRFGAPGTTVAYLLTQILTDFRVSHPGVDVELVEADDVSLEEQVLDGKLDCAVITCWMSTRAASRRLLSEELLLMIPRGHRLAGLPAASLDLVREPVLLPPPGTNMYSVITDAFSRAGIEPKMGHSSSFPELTWNLIRMGLGVALVPKMLAFPTAPEGLLALPLEPPLSRELRIIYSWDQPLSSACRALMTHLQNQILLSPPREARLGEGPDRSRRLRRTVDAPRIPSD